MHEKFETSQEKKNRACSLRLREICAEQGIETRDALARSRKKRFVEMRVFLAKTLYAENHSVASISQALGRRNESTIRYYLLDGEAKTKRKTQFLAQRKITGKP